MPLDVMSLPVEGRQGVLTSYTLFRSSDIWPAAAIRTLSFLSCALLDFQGTLSRYSSEHFLAIFGTLADGKDCVWQ